MGYFDISIDGSDEASDLNWVVERESTIEGKIEKLLRHLDKPQTRFNTPSPVNVALVLTEGTGKDIPLGVPRVKWLLYLTRIRLIITMVRAKVSPVEEWTSEGSKITHVAEFQRLLDQLIQRQEVGENESNCPMD